MIFNNSLVQNMIFNGFTVQKCILDGKVVFELSDTSDEGWTIDDSRYIIGEDGNYYQYCYKGEYLESTPTVNLNSQWVKNTVSTNLDIIPDCNYYMSNSNYKVKNGYAQMQIKWSGIRKMTIWYRSNGESSYDYLVISKMDAAKWTTKPSYTNSNVLVHTRSVPGTTYKQLDIECDEGEHWVWCCYLKDSSGDIGDDRAFVGVPQKIVYSTITEEKRGKMLPYEYVKSNEIVDYDDDHIQYKYYKTWYTPNGVAHTTSDYRLGDIVPKPQDTIIVNVVNALTATTLKPYDINVFGATYLRNEAGDNSSQRKLVFDGDVTQIGAKGFYSLTNISQIVSMPNTVTSIGTQAFQNCRNINTVKLSTRTSSIESNAFYNCSSLSDITIPSTVTSIGDNAFYNCSSITSMDISSVSEGSLGKYVFNGCSQLNEIIINKDWTYVPDYAFHTCGITSIDLPDSVTSINQYAFYNCTNLTTFNTGKIDYINTNAFNSLKRLEVSKHTTHLGSTSNNYSGNCFKNCINLEYITVDSENPKYNDKGGLNAIYKTNTLITGSANSVVSEDCTRIDNDAFNGINITSIDIPDSVTGLSTGAFQKSKLKYFEFNNIKQWSTYCFDSCTDMKWIDLGSNITDIGSTNIQKCSNLHSIMYKGKVYFDKASLIQAFNDNGVKITGTILSNTGLLETLELPFSEENEVNAPLTLVALEDGVQIGIGDDMNPNRYGCDSAVRNFYYRINPSAGSNSWHIFSYMNNFEVTLNKGDYVQLASSPKDEDYSSEDNKWYDYNTEGRSPSFAYKVKTSGNVAAFGNVMSLLNRDSYPWLVRMAEGALSGVFGSCTGLVKAPLLPCEILNVRCYEGMFQGCSSLVYPPELPATVGAEMCYSYMFNGCSSLVNAPQLQLRDLSRYGTSAYVYSRMFQGCSSLKRLTLLANIITQPYFVENMLEGVSPNGTLTIASDATWKDNANIISRMYLPSGWKIKEIEVL